MWFGSFFCIRTIYTLQACLIYSVFSVIDNFFSKKIQVQFNVLTFSYNAAKLPDRLKFLNFDCEITGLIVGKYIFNELFLMVKFF